MAALLRKGLPSTIGALVCLAALTTPSAAMSLREAISIAVRSNPDIGAAIANREATEFKLRQGRGHYLPSIDLQGDLSAEHADNPSSRAVGDQNHLFFRRQGSMVIRQLLFDGFRTDSEVQSQASQVDSASYQVADTSQFIALSVVRAYLDIFRLRRSVNFARQNIAYLSGLLSRIRRGTQGGSYSVADRQQAQERYLAARAQLAGIRGDLDSADATFAQLVGQAVGNVSLPKSVVRSLPHSLNQTLSMARKNHPSIKSAAASVDAAVAQEKKAEADFYPQLALEARGSVGSDLGGLRGHDYGARVGVVMDWNLYSGGVKRAHVQEQVRRVDEARMKLRKAVLAVDKAVNMAWTRRVQEGIRLGHLRAELATQSKVVNSYKQQFEIGKRSLLDLLDAQNSKFAVQISTETANASTLLSEYRILAATGTLLKTVAVKEPPQARAYARPQADVPATPSANSLPRYAPTRDGSLGPLY